MPAQRITLSALALFAATSASADEDFFRVFIADHAAPTITVLDLAQPDNRWTFRTEGPASLSTVAGGRVIAAVQGAANMVHFLDSGVTFESHGNHMDLVLSDPRPFADPLEGERPAHVVNHGGATAITFDGGGYAHIMPDAALIEGLSVGDRFDLNMAHHGFVAPMGDIILSTVATAPESEGGSIPRLGLQAHDRDGAPIGDLATCTAIHGEAFSGNWLAAGCAEGVLTAQPEGDSVSYAMIAYPADFPAGTTGTLHGGDSLRIFLGNHGADGLAVIDPAEGTIQRIALPFARVDFLLDQGHPGTGWALTADGSLHRVDLLTATLTDSAAVTGPYSTEGGSSVARPRLAMAGDAVLVTDPAAGLLRVISTADLSEVAAITLRGAPSSIAVSGGSGEVH